MANSKQHQGWISRTSLRPNTGLALAVVVGLVVVATPLAQARKLSVLHDFCPGGSFCSDGQLPSAGLVRDAKGNLYGTTSFGGSNGVGTVFEVDASGSETLLYSFTGGTDGGYPYAPLIRDADGNLYGTTLTGGDLSSCSGSGCGTVFKVDASDTETVLYSFSGYPDGCYPYGGMLRDSVGNLYGTTSNCGAYNQGTVFKLDTSGAETVLHSFTGGTTDGCDPFGTPTMDKSGNLYGTTDSCGASGDGIVWKLSKKGTETVLHNFAGGSSDGALPVAGVIMDAKGNLYGVTQIGGASNYGTVYELNKKGTLTLLHSFGGSDGENPYAVVLWDAKGNLYGTAVQGGSDNYGTLWKLTP